MNTYPAGYYVYAYLRKDGTPYYIGKGSSSRAWTKGSKEVGKPTDPSRIIIVESNLTSVGAFAIERRLIRWYGRIDQNTGILRNQTNGGDGGCGLRSGRTLSKETKQKISLAHKGKKRSPMSEESKRNLSKSMKGKNKGKIRSEEVRRAQSQRQKGKPGHPHTKESKEKLSKARLGKKMGPMSGEQKEKISNALKGRIRSEEHCKKLSIANKGRKQTGKERENYLKSMIEGITKCEFCGFSTTKGNYRRWHGINCKHKVNNKTQ